MILSRIMSLVMDGIPQELSIKTLNLKDHYQFVFESIHRHLVLVVLPEAVPPPVLYEHLQIMDLPIEAYDDIFLGGVWYI